LLAQLAAYTAPDGTPAPPFLLPPEAMAALYEHVVATTSRDVLELGTGHGATSCVLAAALRRIGGAPLITVDRTTQHIGVDVLARHVAVHDYVEPIVEPLGYEWYLADLVARHSAPCFDLVFLDGAHEWVPDALAVYLVTPLLRPGGWLVLDDINFTLRQMPWWRETHGDRSDRELDTAQVGMVFQLVVRRHPLLHHLKVTHAGRVGWAQRRESGPESRRDRLRRALTGR
jgi:predicted O-methyltransferase YrrM